MPKTEAFYTTEQVARQLGVPQWKVRRLYEDGTLEEPQKFGNKRVILESMVVGIRLAMEKRGWLPSKGKYQRKGPP